MKLFKVKNSKVGFDCPYLWAIFSFDRDDTTGAVSLWNFPYNNADAWEELESLFPKRGIQTVTEEELMAHPDLEWLEDMKETVVVTAHSGGGSMWEAVDAWGCWTFSNMQEAMVVYKGLTDACTNEDSMFNIMKPDIVTDGAKTVYDTIAQMKEEGYWPDEEEEEHEED